jgi:hypothetical protein
VIILDHHHDDRHRSSRSSSTIITMVTPIVAIIVDHHHDDRHRSSRSSSIIITMIIADRRNHTVNAAARSVQGARDRGREHQHPRGARDMALIFRMRDARRLAIASGAVVLVPTDPFVNGVELLQWHATIGPMGFFATTRFAT